MKEFVRRIGELLGHDSLAVYIDALEYRDASRAVHAAGDSRAVAAIIEVASRLAAKAVSREGARRPRIAESISLLVEHAAERLHRRALRNKNILIVVDDAVRGYWR